MQLLKAIFMEGGSKKAGALMVGVLLVAFGEQLGIPLEARQMIGTYLVPGYVVGQGIADVGVALRK